MVVPTGATACELRARGNTRAAREHRPVATNRRRFLSGGPRGEPALI